MNSKEVMEVALKRGFVIPAFNIPHLPMVKPIIQAVVDENAAAMIQVARVEWEKFESQSLEAVAQEYFKYENSEHVMLHLDHIPVIDEDFETVDYMSYIKKAIDAGYKSVMVDGSRLSLEDNIAATYEVASYSHSKGVPCEAELGAVMGHENTEMPPYEEIFKSRKGFTIVEEAAAFAKKSQCDWLSVAVGNIHGAVAEAVKDQKKPEARLDIAHIETLQKATDIPLVLHGGSGINLEYILKGIKAGVAKINIGTEVRQSYEQALSINKDVEEARQRVYETVREMIFVLRITDSKDIIDSALK